MKLTGTRCTLLSYRTKTLNKIHEKSFQILNRQHRIVMPKNYEVKFDCSSLLSEGSKPQHRKDLKLKWESSWEEHPKGEHRESSWYLAEGSFFTSSAEFWSIDASEITQCCVKNQQKGISRTILGTQPGSYSSCSHQTKWENFVITHGALVGYSEGSLFLQ